MSFRDELAFGAVGVRCDLPGEVAVSRPAFVRVVDRDRGVTASAVTAPFRLDLRDPNRIRADVECHARHIFEETFASLNDDEKRPFPWYDGRPRTADPTWTPVIETGVVDLPGGPALRVLRRLQYRPGCDWILGSLLVPIADGTFELTVQAADNQTGYRESALMMVARQKTKDDSFLAQSEYDHPRHDAQFPDHCLSRVRTFLRDIPVEVLAKGEALAPGPVSVAEAKCSLVPPPRFVPVTPGSMPGAPGLAYFTRVTVGVLVAPRTFSVQRRAPGAGRLKEIAERDTRDWERSGVSEIEIVSEELKRSLVSLRVRFVSGGERWFCAQLWTVAADGAIYRLASDAPVCFAEDEVMGDVTQSLATLQSH